MVDDFQGLAKTAALIGGQRDLVFFALVIEFLLTAPDHSAYFDNLANTGQGRIIGNPMKAFDHLRARGTQAKHTTPL